MLRNVSRRPLVVALSRGAAAAGVADHVPSVSCSGPAARGRSRCRSPPGCCPQPRAPSRVSSGRSSAPGTAAHPWSAAVPVTRRAVVTGVALSGRRSARATATRRPRVRRRANRRLGRAAPDPSADRARAPALPGPSAGSARSCAFGRASGQVRLRDHRTRSHGGRLRGGAYALRVVGTPVGASRRPASGSLPLALGVG